MDKESLKLAKNILLRSLEEQKEINKIDTLELMMNITQFLDENEYDKNIKTLSLTKKRKRY